MKIFTFHAGLGNQIFQYVYYLYLRRKYPNETFYGFYPERALRGHNGLEIQKWFDVSLPPSTHASNAIAKSLFWINKLFWKMQKPHPLTDTDLFRRPNALFYYGYWQDKQYFLEVGAPRFHTDLILGEDNERLLQQINTSNSVTVHVRRGDYLSSKARHIYGDICTLDYYQRAINTICEKVDNPVFFFFSDDTKYVEEKFKDVNKVIVNCNKDERSFFDLYLMAHCKHMIIANSTFSTWAAYLNKNNPIVVCPAKFLNNCPSPPIIFDEWIKL